MKRIIAIVCCLVVLSVTALSLRVYQHRARQDGALASNPTRSNGQAGDQSLPTTENAAVDPRLFELPVKVAFWGDDQFCPCFFDPDNKTLYAWKGVVLRSDQVPRAYSTIPSRMRLFNVKKFNYSVLSVGAPVKYRESNGAYLPGYLDRSTHTFFQWKGIVLRDGELLHKSQDGKDPFLKPAFPSQRPPDVIEIDMPAHLKDQPGLWKKS